MLNRCGIRCAAACLAAALCTSILRAEYAMAERDADGMRDVMLCYASPRAWSVEHFRPYVAYLDPGNGQPHDWFFDAWLMLQYGGSPSGAAYIDGPTTKADWVSFLESEWAAGRNLDALDACIGQMAGTLGKPARPHPVILMIPYPSVKQTAFGDVNGDGTSEDLSRPGDRQRAVAWFIDEAIRRWQATPRQHLRLWGFYWMNEGIGAADHEIVKQTCAYVHGKGLKAYWIPWFRAPGYESWKELGFDVAVMQPNFAFVGAPAGLRLGDDQRLSANAGLSQAAGLGVEMEMSDAVVSSPEGRWNLSQYLNHGLPEMDGYMTGVARAWYQGTDLIRRLAESVRPEYRQLYDDLYRFHVGTYARRPWSMAEGRPVAVDAMGKTSSVALLTDGAWGAPGTQAGAALQLSGGAATLRLDLAEVLVVSNVRLHLRDNGVLQQVQVRTSRDGKAWEPAEAVEVSQGQIAAGPGFRLLSLWPVLARQVELVLQWQADATLELDEVVVPPDGDALWGCRGEVHGSRVEWALGVSRVLHCLRVGPFPAGQGGMATARVGDLDLPARAAGPDGWAEWLLPPIVAHEVACTYTGNPLQTALTAVAIPARNAALRRPYTLKPAFAAKYPDSGRELTDGVVSAAGFPDGRTVGWYGVAPCVVFDLGRDQALDQLRIHAQGGGYAAVQFPGSLDIAVAGADGSWRPLPPRFRPLSFVVPADSPAARQLGWAECALGGVSARQLRLQFGTPLGGWTMLSEIEIRSHDANLATTATYALQPAPSGDDPYSDTNGFLTDGVYSGSGWKGCAGWNQGTPEITVDLQRETPVSQIVVHLVGGGAGAVYFPERIEASLSTDGTTWTAAGTSSDRPDDRRSKDRRNGVMALRLDAPRPARFLRLVVQRHGWTMVDEVEVY